MDPKNTKPRSRDWFGKDGLIYRAWMKNQGFPAAECYDRQVIAPFDRPFKPESGIAVDRGYVRLYIEHVE